MISRLLPLLAALYAAASLAAASLAPAAEPLVFPVSEAPFPALLDRIDGEWNFHFRVGEKLRVLSPDSLAYWGRLREAEMGPQILLTDGSLLRADVLSLDEKAVVLGDATGLGRGQWDESTLPRAALSAIVYQPPADAAERDRLPEELAALPPHQDCLLLRGGEHVAGTLLAAPRQGRFADEANPPGGETFTLARASGEEPLSIPAGKVVAFRPFRGAAPRTAPAKAWLGLADGSLVRAQSIAIEGDELTISPAAGGELKTTLSGRDDAEKTFWDGVVYVQPDTERLLWLSRQESLGYKHIPFLSVHWPLGIDRSALGGRLRAGGALFLQGLGMPSTSRVAYDVAGYRRFAAEIALDDAAGRKGSVVFKVLLQTTPESPAENAREAWTVAYASPVVRGGDPPLPVSVDLKGARRMALIVDFADRGDECDWADWLNARLTK